MRKPVSFSLESKTVRKLSELVKRLGGVANRSELVEFLISKYLPEPEDKEGVENLAVDVAKWKLENSQSKNTGKQAIIILPNET
jgi:Arc/MetJ-type ribon-helix-helix transcriptional regulator